MTEQELLGYLRDAAQGASNSAASTVSAPVDLLAWMLNKGGIPVQNPVLGSDWMAQKGLTAKPANALAGMAGETLGNISPIVAAAKAPQIANALLRAEQSIAPTVADMAERYMVRQGMIQPATVWHGSPHKFDKFDASKIGTGEGAQAYGHGLYLADNKTVADDYAKAGTANLSGYVAGLKGQADGIREALTKNQMFDGRNWIPLTAEQRAQYQSILADNEAKIAAAPEYARSLYKVDIPDNAIARMLDWDKPLSQQAPEVRAAVQMAFPGTHINGRFVDPMSSGKAGRALLDELSVIADKRGDPGMRMAESALQQAGIPGIRYLDGGSRGAGAGTSNYVVFPGEENMLRILERNGVPIGK